jgi:hypothetical protein
MLTKKNTGIDPQDRKFHEYKTQGYKNDERYLLLMNMAEQQVDPDKGWRKWKTDQT